MRGRLKVFPALVTMFLVASSSFGFAEETMKEKALFNLRALLFSARHCSDLTVDTVILADFINTQEKIGIDITVDGTNKNAIARYDSILQEEFTKDDIKFCVAVYNMYGPNILKHR